MSDNAISLEQLMQEGTPFMIVLTTNPSDEVKIFDLDSDTYDTVSGFFENKMLWVSGIKVTPGATATIEALRFDDKIVWAGQVADEFLDLSGVGYESATPLAIAPSNVKSKFGVDFLPVRNQFSLKNITGDAVASTVVIWGVYTRRTA